MSLEAWVEWEFLGLVTLMPFDVGVGGTTFTPFGIGGSDTDGGADGGGDANDCTEAVLVLNRPENSEVRTPATLLPIVSCSSCACRTISMRKIGKVSMACLLEGLHISL